jgi:hypothetical protein
MYALLIYPALFSTFPLEINLAPIFAPAEEVIELQKIKSPHLPVLASC